MESPCPSNGFSYPAASPTSTTPGATRGRGPGVGGRERAAGACSPGPTPPLPIGKAVEGARGEEPRCGVGAREAVALARGEAVVRPRAIIPLREREEEEVALACRDVRIKILTVDLLGKEPGDEVGGLVDLERDPRLPADAGRPAVGSDDEPRPCFDPPAGVDVLDRGTDAGRHYHVPDARENTGACLLCRSRERRAGFRMTEVQRDRRHPGAGNCLPVRAAPLVVAVEHRRPARPGCDPHRLEIQGDRDRDASRPDQLAPDVVAVGRLPFEHDDVGARPRQHGGERCPRDPPPTMTTSGSATFRWCHGECNKGAAARTKLRDRPDDRPGPCRPASAAFLVCRAGLRGTGSEQGSTVAATRSGSSSRSTRGRGVNSASHAPHNTRVDRGGRSQKRRTSAVFPTRPRH